MSSRHPTVDLNGQVIAYDEIVEVIELKQNDAAARGKTASRENGLRLVDGTVLPLAPQHLGVVINFLQQGEF